MRHILLLLAYHITENLYKLCAVPKYQVQKYPPVPECVIPSAPSYLEHIRSPATSSAAPFHLGFVHHRAALFLADPIQHAVGLQGGRERCQPTKELLSWMSVVRRLSGCQNPSCCESKALAL